MDAQRLHQIVMEERYSRRHIHDRVSKYLRADAEFSQLMDTACSIITKWLYAPCDYDRKQDLKNHIIQSDVLVDEIVTDILVAVMTGEYSNIQSVCGRVSPTLKFDNIYDAVEITASIVVIIGLETDLYDIILPEDSELDSITIEANYMLSEEMLQYLAHTKYLPPMIVKPKHVRKNYDYDYYTVESSKLLNTYYDMPIALDVLNILNGVQLELDLYTLAHREVPNHELDTPKKREQFDRMVIASEVVYEELLQMSDGKFYNTWKYDARGRFYSQGYHVHLQATDYKKSLINLAKKEIVELF